MERAGRKLPTKVVDVADAEAEAKADREASGEAEADADIDTEDERGGGGGGGAGQGSSAGPGGGGRGGGRGGKKPRRRRRAKLLRPPGLAPPPASVGDEMSHADDLEGEGESGSAGVDGKSRAVTAEPAADGFSSDDGGRSRQDSDDGDGDGDADADADAGTKQVGEADAHSLAGHWYKGTWAGYDFPQAPPYDFQNFNKTNVDEATRQKVAK